MQSATKNTGRIVYVVDGARTPFLKAQGKPGPFSASDLAVSAGKHLLARQPFDASDLDEVILGCTMPSVNEANIARVVALRLGAGHYVPAWTVQRNCASGLQAVDNAFKDIACGRHDLVLAGGTEAMSRAPLLYNDAMVNWLAKWYQSRTLGQRLKTLAQIRVTHFVPVIALLKGLTDPLVGLSMGQTAEILAHRFGITREEMDAFAAQSHVKTLTAYEEGRLSEVETLYDCSGHYYSTDDGARTDSTPDKLATLRPYFDKKYGKVTPGNSSQVTDGAAMLLLASEDAVEKYSLKPLAKIIDTEWSACDPAQMGLGPAYSIAALLKRFNLGVGDIDLYEINEAFAAQVIACLRALESDTFCKEELGLDKAFGHIPLDRLNTQGGAISLGHPVGASGARLALHLSKSFKSKTARYGIASLCIGGGQGGAMLLEAV